MRTGLICAGLGVVVAALILIIMGAWWFVGGFNPHLAVGVATLFVGSGFWGKKAGVYLCRRGNNTGLNISIGIALAFGSIAIAVLAGALGYVFVHDANDIVEVTEIPGIFLGSLIIVLLFGAIPAAVLGVVYGLLVGMQLDK